MDPASVAGIGIGTAVGCLGILKLFKKILGFKSCKLNSDSDEDRCLLGCVAKKSKKSSASKNIEKK